MLPLKGNKFSVTGTLEVTSSFNRTTLLPVHEDGLSVWIPLIVVIAFVVIIIFLILVSRRMCCCCEKEPAQLPIIVDDHNGANVNEAFTNGADGVPVPETPPPAYNDLARQLSYVSYISQSSSQIEVPPEYDEAINAVEYPSESSRVRFGAIFNFPSRLRIFSRSISSDALQTLPTFVSQSRAESNSCRRSTIAEATDSRSTSQAAEFPTVFAEFPTVRDSDCVESNLLASDVSAVVLSTTSVQNVDDPPVTFVTDSDAESDSGVMMMN